VELDKTAYPTLQEGVEHANFDDMARSTHTFQSSHHFLTQETSWQNLLHKQLLVLEARKYKLAPLKHAILPHSLQSTFCADKALTPLIGMTL